MTLHDETRPQPEPAALDVRNLSVDFRLGDRWAEGVSNLNFTLQPGETLGFAGESGCGKSTVALALMHLLDENARSRADAVLLNGHDISDLSERELMPFRWKEMSLIFQGAMNAVNPVRRIGAQLRELLVLRQGMPRREANARIEELFTLIGIHPERANDYPHEFSGGMKQRVMIAMALALNPKVVIADECTTALDVIIQQQIMELLRSLKTRLKLSMIFISHDLALIAEICDRVAIMYSGRIVEIGPVTEVIQNARHPYTRMLVGALPRLTGDRTELVSIPGTPPRITEKPGGCLFAPRCPFSTSECSATAQSLRPVGGNHDIACSRLADIDRMEPQL